MHSFLTDRHTQSRVYRPLLEAWMHPDGQFIFYQGSCSIEGEKKVRFLSVFHSFCLIPGWWQEEKLRNIERVSPLAQLSLLGTFSQKRAQISPVSFPTWENSSL